MIDGWVSVSDCEWVSASECDCGIAACYANGLALAQLGLQFRHIQPLSYPQGIFLIIAPIVSTGNISHYCCFTLGSVIDLGAEVLV